MTTRYQQLMTDHVRRVDEHVCTVTGTCDLLRQRDESKLRTIDQAASEEYHQR